MRISVGSTRALEDTAQARDPQDSEGDSTRALEDTALEDIPCASFIPHQARRPAWAWSTMAFTVLVVCAASTTRAEPLRVMLAAPDELHAGDRASLELQVWAQSHQPVMVTPRSEGAAIEVVRGRLLRPDAADPLGEPLTFRIRIVAREPGPARVLVRVDTFHCDRGECEPWSEEARVALRVTRDVSVAPTTD